LAQSFDVVSQQQGFTAHARRRQTGLGTSMAATNHNHIKTFRENHRATTLQSKLRIKYFVSTPHRRPLKMGFRKRARIIERVEQLHKTCTGFNQLIFCTKTYSVTTKENI
jgi:hypothetical protein